MPDNQGDATPGHSLRGNPFQQNDRLAKLEQERLDSIHHEQGNSMNLIFRAPPNSVLINQVHPVVGFPELGSHAYGNECLIHMDIPYGMIINSAILSLGFGAGYYGVGAFDEYRNAKTVQVYFAPELSAVGYNTGAVLEATTYGEFHSSTFTSIVANLQNITSFLIPEGGGSVGDTLDLPQGVAGSNNYTADITSLIDSGTSLFTRNRVFVVSYILDSSASGYWSSVNASVVIQGYVHNR